MGKSANQGLVVRDWKPDVVYLVQLPRTHYTPSPSPFGLKLETWLRMNGIKYRNVSNEFKKTSAKGQVPFIELNGRQFADSNFIIDHLRNHFKLAIDGKLNSMERAHFRSYTVLIEESLFRCVMYDRSINFGWITTDKGFLPSMHGVHKVLFSKLGQKKFQNMLKRILHFQGYGRHSPADIDEIASKDLMALSTFLGDKLFMFGDNPTTLDATLFGHLAQFTECPINSTAVKPLLEKSAPNLLHFMQRMKRRFWPDWNEVIEYLAMNPEEVVEKKQQAQQHQQRAQ